MSGNCSSGSRRAATMPIDRQRGERHQRGDGRRSAKSRVDACVRLPVARRGVAAAGVGDVHLAIQRRSTHRDDHSVRNVATMTPPITVIAIGARISAPSPKPIAIGSRPRIVRQLGDQDGPQASAPRLGDGRELLEAALARLVDGVDQHDRRC